MKEQTAQTDRRPQSQERERKGTSHTNEGNTLWEKKSTRRDCRENEEERVDEEKREKIKKQKKQETIRIDNRPM
jgi:hypothetical protein